MAKAKGSPKTGGRKKGVQNKTTADFKESLNKLLQLSAPKMIQWMDRVAAKDPGKALEQIGKLAEYVHPKLSRAQIGNDPENPLPPTIVAVPVLTMTESEWINQASKLNGHTPSSSS